LTARLPVPRVSAEAAWRWALRVGSVVVCLALWEIASRQRLDLRFVAFKNIPAPSEVAEAALMPPLELLRPIPAVAWIPLAILAFPSSELSMIWITFIGALFPILLATIHGVESLDPRLVASARSLGAGRRAILFEVVLPGASPAIVTGLAIGMGTSWFCLVTAEMISGQFGIGYYTWEAYTLQNYADIVVGMAIIGVLGMASSWAVKRLGALAMPWRAPPGPE